MMITRRTTQMLPIVFIVAVFCSYVLLVALPALSKPVTPAAAGAFRSTWLISTLPAAAILVIDNPEKAAGRYEVTDMYGRKMMTGSLSGGRQTVDIGTLAPGSYRVDCYQGLARVCNCSILKE
jgi:hypothetical protein